MIRKVCFTFHKCVAHGRHRVVVRWHYDLKWLLNAYCFSVLGRVIETGAFSEALFAVDLHFSICQPWTTLNYRRLGAPSTLDLRGRPFSMETDFRALYVDSGLNFSSLRGKINSKIKYVAPNIIFEGGHRKVGVLLRVILKPGRK